ncbi:KRI1-like family C-terminal-domain-containing protein [Paraphysoderma sedebokerense]|nr:KRI1-like family C-terminal-domain-containing protein [Paraphysoderma sedebokerense]
MSLFDEDSSNFQLSINTEFARKYEHKKKAEELSILKDKYGDISLSDDQLEKVMHKQRKYGKDSIRYNDMEDVSDESTSEEEDEDGELVTAEVDAQIMKTLTMLQTKNPRIYDKDFKAFDGPITDEVGHGKSLRDSKNDGKSMKLKDYERETLLKGITDLEEAEQREISNLRKELTHVEEQSQLKDEFKKILQSAAFNDDAEDSDDDFFSKRQKSLEEQKAEEEDYKSFLLKNMAAVDSAHGSGYIKRWEQYKERHDIDDNEKFLMDFILNKGWVSNEDKLAPSYDQIVGDIDDDEDEEAVEQAEEFERVYNFRYEEQGGAHLQTFSRNIEGTVRRKDDARKRAREAKKERQERERLQKLEELKRLKNLKKQEIHEKLKQIQEITGSSVVGLEDIDLDTDFDPDQYDTKMSKIFNDDYYEAEDASVKPNFGEDIDVTDLIGDESEQEELKPDAEILQNSIKSTNDESAEELDIEPALPTKKKSKSKSKKPFDEFIDEYYQLDYEDMIGDLPTRFKYREVPSTDFGLRVEEILAADDKELNSFVSLKKIAPFRPPAKVQADIQKYGKKKRLQQFRKQIAEKLEELQSSVAESEANVENSSKSKFRKRKGNDENGYEYGSRQHKKQKSGVSDGGKSKGGADEGGVSLDRLAAYMPDSKKKKGELEKEQRGKEKREKEKKKKKQKKERRKQRKQQEKAVADKA